MVVRILKQLELQRGVRRQAGREMILEFQLRDDSDDHTLLGGESDQSAPLATHAVTQHA